MVVPFFIFRFWKEDDAFSDELRKIHLLLFITQQVRFLNNEYLMFTKLLVDLLFFSYVSVIRDNKELKFVVLSFSIIIIKYHLVLSFSIIIL